MRMNILVYDVAASESGALSVLKDFYIQAKNTAAIDIHWFFVISTPELPDCDNITVIRYPKIKKSWFHRLAYDSFIPRKLCKKHKIDLAFSLQDVLVPGIRIPQVIFLHDSLLFADKRFGLFENPVLWLYQNPLALARAHSIKKADKVIVQTEWMKRKSIERTGVSPGKISVVRPRVDCPPSVSFPPLEIDRHLFFYPAAAFEYKNHMTVLKACEMLAPGSYRVIFTLSGTENEYSAMLKRYSEEKELSVEFSGTIPHEKVYDLYRSSVLLFPSYIESFGLPLAEAKASNAIIISTNCGFSKEILCDYPNALFFDKFDYKTLAHKMIEAQNIEIMKNDYAPQEEDSICDEILSFCEVEMGRRNSP